MASGGHLSNVLVREGEGFRATALDFLSLARERPLLVYFVFFVVFELQGVHSPRWQGDKYHPGRAGRSPQGPEPSKIVTAIRPPTIIHPTRRSNREVRNESSARLQAAPPLEPPGGEE